MKPLWRRTKPPKPVSLFDELIERAPTDPLPRMLTSLSILAKALKNPELQQWADLEIGGYFKEDPAMTESIVVPEYRAVPGCWRDEQLHRTPQGDAVGEDQDARLTVRLRAELLAAEAERVGFEHDVLV